MDRTAIMGYQRDPVKHTGRNRKRRVFAVHHDVVNHPRWAQLSAHAKVLWLELGLEYHPGSADGKRPSNNGAIACPYKHLVERRGFKSRTTIKEALDELEYFGFIEKTHPGCFPREPARYLLTHLDVEPHPDNYVQTRMRATHDYKKHSGAPFTKRPRSKTPPTVPRASPVVAPSGPTDGEQQGHVYAEGTRGKKAHYTKSRRATNG